MKNIAIGDKVRVLSSTEEGLVVGIKNDIVEVEIEDGFTIPVLNRDIVLVSGSEREYFGGDSTSDQEVEQETFVSRATGEVYVSLVKHQNASGYQLSIINHMTDALFYHAYRKKESRWIKLESGQLSNLTFQTLGKTVSDGETISISYLKLVDDADTIPKSIENTFKVKSQWFLKELPTIPLIRLEGHFFPIGTSTIPIDTDELKNAMFSKSQSESKSTYSPVGNLLDLHIEELTDTPETLSKNDILPFQLKVFESHLDKAISAGNDELTVVHGVGNGTLKHNVQKKLSGHPHIAYFKDAQKEKFGYGAIYIKFK
ncbi:MAG: Smr/MutS family protein [Cyclobacteriaceae bacterium]